MKNMLVMTLFILAMIAWAAAQQPGTQPSKPGSADQAGSRAQEPQAPVTEGCLGGSAPNYTITDSSGTVYKLNMPPNADTSKLASHVGESVQVQGDVKDAGKPGNASIDVQAIGRGTGSCPAGAPKNTQSPPKR
jgi:hypothetical protein